jgi:hypothetical protein
MDMNMHQGGGAKASKFENILLALTRRMVVRIILK